jgi:hypothetical protein
VTARWAPAAAALLFLLVATANSGGYRYGISDQAFYAPVVALATDPALFPRDSAILAPQMRWWLGGDVLGAAMRVWPGDPLSALPVAFAFLYVIGVLLLAAAAMFLMRGLGASWWATAGALALLTLRHRIAKTGANSLEGYAHPRMLAFAIGLFALGFLLRRRLIPAVLLVALAAVVHPTTALWFAPVVGLGILVSIGVKRPWRWTALALAVIAAAGGRGERMDVEWLAALAEKDYLFPNEWPAYAWAINLAYPVVIWALHRARAARGWLRPGETPMVIGLLALVAGFGVSVPLAAAHVAWVVQLQVNRVFWILDAVALLYLAWWWIDGLASRRAGWLRPATAVLLIALAAGRGVFILADTGRPMARIDLPADDWTAAMRWLRQQPTDWQVLADPAHAWMFGSSVRVAAFRDTVIEAGKDSAMAMYDRDIARRVNERRLTLSGFADMTAADFRDAGRRFDAQVLVVERSRALDLPVLWSGERLVIHDLR